MEHSPFEKLTVPELVTKLPAFYGTRRFVTLEVIYSPTNAQVIVLKTILKFTLK